MIDAIGEAAGEIWQALDGVPGGLTVIQIRNRTELPDNLLHQGLGWLAREGKIRMAREGKATRVALTG